MYKVLDKGFIEMVNVLGDDSSILNAARVSFNNDKTIVDIDRDKKLIKYLLLNKHTSPFEHVVFTFHVKCPLFVRSQWMRHRTWSFNEISRRYTSDDIDFYIPTELRKQSESDRQASTDDYIEYINTEYCDADGSDYEGTSVSDYLEHFVKQNVNVYNELIAQGVAREQARMVLPQNMYTRFYATVDLHNLLHFIELRSSPHAQYEIRCYSDALLDLIVKQVPLTIVAWREINGKF